MLYLFIDTMRGKCFELKLHCALQNTSMGLIRHHAVEEHLGYIVSIISIIVLMGEGQKKSSSHMFPDRWAGEERGHNYLKR